MRPHFSRAELLPALAIGVPLVAEVLVDGAPEPSDLVHAALALLTGVGLLWRIRRPLVALGVVYAMSMARWGLDGGGDGLHWLALLVAIYSVGAHGQGRDGLIAGLMLLAGLAPVEVPKLANGEWGGVTGSTLSMAIVYGMGRFVGGHSRRAREAEERASAAEQERDLRAQEAVVEERARVARELHDIVAHHVSVMVIQAQAAQRLVDPGEGEAKEALTAIEVTGREALVELRRLLDVLRRSTDGAGTGPQPGLAQLPDLIGTARDAGLPVQLRTEGEPVTLPAGLDLSAYRIVQEAVTNAMRYAGRARTDVLVRYRPDAVELEIRDEGPGVRSPAGVGHGLAGMRERVSLYGGVLEAGPCPDKGFLVQARLPR